VVRCTLCRAASVRKFAAVPFASHINNCDNGKESIDYEIDFAIGKLLLKQPL
jgi:hypothetical protein